MDENATLLAESLAEGDRGLQQAVSDALSIEGSPAGGAGIEGFYVERDRSSQDRSAMCYLLAAGRLHRIESDMAQQSLIVTVPLGGVRQVVERRSGVSVRLTIEVDADVTVETTFAEAITGPGELGGDPVQISRSEARTTIVPTIYRIDAEGLKAAELKTFAKALRRQV